MFSQLGLLVFLLLTHGVFAADDAAFTESVVIFNTICAKCHEAECSGRLSFDEGLKKSASHIQRHYQRASGKLWLQRELFSILNYMKEKCAYYPMKVHVPLKRVWGEDVLDQFMTLMEKNYFIPVGKFSPGKYRMELELDKDAKVTIHLISEEFEMVAEDCYRTIDGRIDIPVFIDQTGNYYFRMYPREPVKITRLAITPLERNIRVPLP